MSELEKRIEEFREKAKNNPQDYFISHEIFMINKLDQIIALENRVKELEGKVNKK